MLFLFRWSWVFLKGCVNLYFKKKSCFYRCFDKFSWSFEAGNRSMSLRCILFEKGVGFSKLMQHNLSIKLNVNFSYQQVTRRYNPTTGKYQLSFRIEYFSILIIYWHAYNSQGRLYTTNLYFKNMFSFDSVNASWLRIVRQKWR